EYACADCGHVFDIFQSFSDDALTECPECGGKLRKVFSPAGVVFKGSGFYRTDSRSSSGSSTSGASSSSSKSDTKAS
ncbi:MAG TPA: zinc ribbon domain-containing protein, partial [Marmoricola sp.]|nr:zinc ribbon domain-containing protein [Marmoricola sp.]